MPNWKFNKLFRKKKFFYTKDFFTDQNFIIGDFTYGKPHVLTDDGSDTKLVVGKFCSIADGVTIFLGANHRVDWLTTYPFPSPVAAIRDLWPQGQDISGFPATKGNVVIGNDVWIGFDATIMSGVTIGDGAVIGTKAVVAGDVPLYAIVAGNPAKLIRKRFGEETIQKLLKIKWWEWPSEKIRKHIPHLCGNNIESFLSSL